MDEESLEREDALYRELRPAVFGVAYRMAGSVSEAEDLAQEVFLWLNGRGLGQADRVAEGVPRQCRLREVSSRHW